MLQHLFISDFALIPHLNIDFEQGLTIVTGQTGAGKSIILGALNLVLGERADTDMIRSGSKKAIVEAHFSVGDGTPELRYLCSDAEIDWEPTLILRREVRSGGSRAFINDTPVTIAILKACGDLLVDLHGQHDHQLLLNEEHHRRFVDQFDEVSLALEAYQATFKEVEQAEKNLSSLKKQERALQDTLELYRFQLRELSHADLNPDEEEQLLHEMQLLDNAESLDQKARFILEAGSEADVNVMDLLGKLIEFLKEMAEMDSEFDPFVTEVETAKISLQEMLRFTQSYQEEIEFNPNRLEDLRLRHTELRRLQKKYSATLHELIEKREWLKEQVSFADTYDIQIEKATKISKELRIKLEEKANHLREARLLISARLANDIVRELQELHIPYGDFKVDIRPRTGGNGWVVLDGLSLDCDLYGTDDIRFLLSTNKGIAPKPLAKIASGGEISRVMLAMKSVFARQHHLPVMIFDEIDTGISGNVSEKVGQMMRKLSSICQIIAITHQPQIASQADHHFVVEKHETDASTETNLRALNEEEHIREVAALMSGATITEASLQSARQLIERRHQK